MASDRVGFAQGLVDLWNSGDYEGWLEAVGDGFEFTPDPSFPDVDTYSGEAFRRWLREWVATWGENRLELLGIEEENECLLIRGRWQLATRQGGGEVPVGAFTMVLFYPDAEAERPNRMEAYFDPDKAREAARARPG